ncbi:DUF3307 domain-containing protein [Rhodobacteraceae bacterium CYK-10]|uniref:DUF3307 domain-containing protein n=2 Tax=Stagnihabitans tardus TaxID=2699202 RepID=A0AAE5BVL1_9RHOB|nr:DUF3307 domain-containing protein [Stagnihabitans tardus]
MTETFAALLLAHVLADFVLQTRWMAEAKREPAALGLHGLVVFATAAAALGSLSPWLLGLTVAHLLTDLAKSLAPKGVAAFLLDQAAHLAAIVALAALQPGLMAQGLWAGLPLVPPLMALVSGLVLATRAGGFMVGLLMAPWAGEAPEGLARGGWLIGQLERGLILGLIVTDQAAGIGFLIAAKSVLRFSDTKTDRKVSEYVIIGTLASVAWALGVSGLTQIQLNGLAPLGIPDLTP